MVQSIGARLRSERERRHIALSAIAAETKIKSGLLEELERDKLTNWPEGIFRRAYVRAYARAVGLDPEAILREFLDAYPEPVETPPADEASGRASRLFTSAISALPEFMRRRPPTPLTITPVPPDAGSCRPQAAPRKDVTLPAVADLCTRVGSLRDTRELRPLLEDAARLVDALGFTLWLWDARAASLVASVAAGYSVAAIAQWPAVPADAPNAVAGAFRSGQPCLVTGNADITGAVAVPVMGADGCAGVLALELSHGGEHRESVRAFATILAAQLANLVRPSDVVEAVA